MKPNLLFTAALLLAVKATAFAAQKPNIVIIYADDLGYGDVQCYNPERGKIPTPNMDRLANEGVRFTDAHSPAAFCTPSRYGLLTGRYPFRNRNQGMLTASFGEPLIPKERLTIATLAQQNGYRTACFGKWHLGFNWPMPEDQKQRYAIKKKNSKGKTLARTASAEDKANWEQAFSQPVEGGPIAVGFDEYFGVNIPNWPPFCYIEQNRTVGIPSEYLSASCLDTPHMASIQGPALEGWTLEPVLPALRDRTVAFIERESKTPEPFFIYMPLTTPHTPLSVNDEWKGKSGLGDYADLVMETDGVVGDVLDALEQSGVAENTLVILTSDNGTAAYIGVDELEAKGHYPSGPLRGYKVSIFEGGHRIPFIVRWPGTVKPGSVCEQMVQQTDLMATFAAMFGTTLPSDAGEDSYNFLPLLNGTAASLRPHGINHTFTSISLRQGDWKYIPAHTGKQKRIETAQLYNLADDLGETNNLAADMPERVEQMHALLNELIYGGRSTRGPKQKNDTSLNRWIEQIPSLVPADS
ncbi:MAG: sulfatase family protein [Coraliomargarita sp.]